MVNDTISIFMKKADEYISKGLQNEKKKDYENARKYYLMASKSILEAAKNSPDHLKISRIQKSDMLLKRVESLPKPIEVGSKKDESVIKLMEKPNVTFEDVAGLFEVKEKIKDLIITPFSHPEIARKWKVRTGGGVLLYGPPGTGKTLLAKAVAGELNADFYYIKASDIMSKWVGASEKKVVDLFKNAREGDKSVIFIDEIDALLPKRTGQSSTIMARVVPQFLAEMDGVDSKNERLLLMAATNVPWTLDEAVLRPGRFDFKFYIDVPDFEARKKIVEINLDVPLEKEFDFNIVSENLQGYSGADIRLVCDEAKRQMFRQELKGENNDLKISCVLEIIEKIKPSVNDNLRKKYVKFNSQVL